MVVTGTFVVYKRFCIMANSEVSFICLYNYYLPHLIIFFHFSIFTNYLRLGIQCIPNHDATTTTTITYIYAQCKQIDFCPCVQAMHQYMVTNLVMIRETRIHIDFIHSYLLCNRIASLKNSNENIDQNMRIIFLYLSFISFVISWK